MKYASAVLLGLVVALSVSGVIVGPLLDKNRAQAAIVSEFVSRYCHPDLSLGEAFRLGDAAALSRLSIKSGLQPIAWAEYLKCKAGL